MITDAEHDQIHSWVEETLTHPKNLCTETELIEQANAAFLAFRKADADSSNALSIPELLRLCEEMGLPAEKDEEEMLMKIDSDGSGEIDISEWMTFWMKRVSSCPNPAKQQEAIARNTFKKFDKDGGGSLDVDELRGLIDSLGAKFTDKEMKEAMKELDGDGSGSIDEAEFISWWVNRTLNARAGGGLIALKLKKLARKAAQLFFTDIFTAVWKNDLSLVKTFLEADSRMANATDTSEYGDGWMPLHYACYQGYGDIVDELLAAGAAVNATNDLGFSALFYAAQYNHIHICKVLIDKGADPAIVGAAIDEPDLFLCPVDHVVDSPELMKLFRSHPRCTPPDTVPADKTTACISELGVIQIDLPPAKLFTTLPIKKWRVLVATASMVSTRATDGIMELIVPGANPNLAQRNYGGGGGGGGSLSIKITMDKRWLKQQVGSDLSQASLFVKLIPINSFEDEGPMSESVPIMFVSSNDQANKNTDGLGGIYGGGASPTALDILATLDEELGPPSADAYLDEDFEGHGGGDAKQQGLGPGEDEDNDEKDYKK